MTYLENIQLKGWVCFMNTPNKLTMLRVLLIPVFVLFMLGGDFIPFNYVGAIVVFILASFTDLLDGKIARKHNIVTNFGKFLDPLADKSLVISAFICLMAFGLVNPVVVIILVMREFLVTSLRLIAAGDGTVIAADIFGKIKTVVQMVSIITILGILCLIQVFDLTELVSPLTAISSVLSWICALVAVLSGANYMYKNRHCIDAKN